MGDLIVYFIQFHPSNCYITRIERNCNLVVPLNHSNFGTQSPIFRGVFLKYNINSANLVNFNKYKNYIYKNMFFCI